MTLSNILITGSTGGLGSNLAYYYANKGHELILHGRDEKKLREIGENKVLAMICDSTNIFYPGRAGSEFDVRQSLLKIMSLKLLGINRNTLRSKISKYKIPGKFGKNNA